MFRSCRLILLVARSGARVAESSAATAQCASALGVAQEGRKKGSASQLPKQDAAAILGEILSEADALIRLRLKEQGLWRELEDEDPDV